MGTGEFRWRNPTARSLKPGQLAGRVNSRGRVQISVDGKRYLASRLAWMYVYGEDPGDMQVDHIEEGATKTDTIWNLQLLTCQKNVAKYHQSWRELPTNVVLSNGRYVAYARQDGVQVYLGSFADVESAEAATLQAP